MLISLERKKDAYIIKLRLFRLLKLKYYVIFFTLVME